jgi:RHS repeat-associated protein
MECDALRRPTQMFVEGNDPIHSDPRTVGNRILYEKMVYGEDYPDGRADAAEQNLLTRAWKQYDSAGVVTNETCDFKGNLLRSSRRLMRGYKTVPDWDTFPEPEDLPDDWEEELFLSSTRYDALNRPIQLVAPHAGSETDVIQPGYNEANLLEKLDVWLKHAGEPAELLTPDTADEHFVTNIDYNARGQRTLIQYGNDAETRYHYDPATFRLVHLYTRRGVSYSDDCGDDPTRYPAPDMPPQDTPCGLQNLHYTYDPAGNITTIRDDAQHTIYFNGQVVRPDAEYTYDALYRLIEACGREHIGQASEPQTTWHDSNRVNLAHPNDGQAMRNYFEFYEYDEVGNILKFDHKAHSSNWIRAYEYDEPSLIELEKNSNRLSCTVVHPNANHPITEPYTYDPHGNITSMPHLPEMAWDFKDQLHMVDKGGGCMAYYVYDAGGQRVRKVIEQDGRRMNERIYFGEFEIYRKYNGDRERPELERETLHVMDDQQRIAMVETRTQGNESGLPAQIIRYQLGNHLGSVSLELDASAQIISYEEYYPYGSTSYQAVRSQTETPKRYRYTGMERDDETGLSYHSARYYAPWLGRWLSADPLTMNLSITSFDFSSNQLANKSQPLQEEDPSYYISMVLNLRDKKDIDEQQLGLVSENTYAYCANNPMKFLDLNGLNWTDAEGNVFSDEELEDVRVYIFHDDDFSSQAMRQYQNAVRIYGEEAVALSNTGTTAGFSEDWGNMRGDIRSVRIIMHGRNQNIVPGDEQQFTATGTGRTNRSNSEAPNIQDLPQPVGDITEATLYIYSCHSADTVAESHGDQGPLLGTEMPVAQAFSETFAFRRVRGTAGSVNFYNWSEGALPGTENYLLPFPVDEYWIDYQGGRRYRHAYRPPPGLIERAEQAVGLFLYNLERHIVWHSAPNLYPLMYGH